MRLKARDRLLSVALAGDEDAIAALAQTQSQRKAKTRRYPETELQAQIVAALRKRNLWVYAVPNGGMMRDTARIRAARLGVISGMPDLCIVAPGGRALYIEVKAPNGRTSQRQQDVIDYLRDLGAPVAVVTSVDDVMRFLAKEKVLCLI